MTANRTTAVSSKLWRRGVRWFVIAAGVLLFADFVLLPFGIAVYAAWPAQADVGAAPDGFVEVEVAAADGVRLAGWYAATRNGAAIILLPGAGGNRNGLREQASMLAEHGFGVLALDPRGNGESDGRTNRFAWDGSLDVGGAAAFLAAQPNVRAIGGWGISAGGEMLLGAIGEVPQIAAVIADGATHRSAEEKFDLESARGALVQFHTGLTYAFLGLLTGDIPPIPMLASIRANDSTRLLLITAGNVPEERAYAALFVDAAAGRAVVWTAPDVGHTVGWDRYRDEYTRRVVAFFTDTLLGDG